MLQPSAIQKAKTDIKEQCPTRTSTGTPCQFLELLDAIALVVTDLFLRLEAHSATFMTGSNPGDKTLRNLDATNKDSGGKNKRKGEDNKRSQSAADKGNGTRAPSAPTARQMLRLWLQDDQKR